MSASERVALVTGANRGIGKEVARQLARDGYLAVVGARDLAAGERASKELGAQGQRVEAAQLDVTNQPSVDRLATSLGQRYGRLDVLVNNAAIDYDTWQQASTADLRRVMEALDTNLLGAWRVTLAVLPLLRAAGHATIVNVSSEAGSLTSMGGGIPAYRASKAALNALTRMLAAELRPDGILVNAICPGWVATEMGGPGGRPVGEGAAGVVWAAELPADGPTGGFFRDGQRLPW